ncbi:MAG: hypothetical protein ABIF08_00725 [Nanoarchaeota archaeon]
MPIIGLSLNSVTAKREKDAKGEIKINSTPRINSIEEKTIEQLGKKVLSIGFDFITTYDSLGEIKLSGDMLFTHDDQEKILKHWKENKILSQDAAVDVFNALFAKCLLKSSMIAEELQLPLPLTLPRVRPGTVVPDSEDKKTEDKKKK